jgi:hypothetical protein
MSKIYLSTCCGAEMKGEEINMAICPDCHEHCTIDEEEQDDWIEQYSLQN